MSELYHYTTAAGLLGMLKDYNTENPDLTMRATHCNYLNDRSEFFWRIKLCCNAIYEYEKQNPIPEEKRLSKYIKIHTMNRLLNCSGFILHILTI